MNFFSKMWNKTNKEIIAGVTTFFTMSYIVILNPLIWSTPGTGVTTSLALTATVLVLVVVNLLAGIFIKLPYAFGPGMGLNAFVVYTVILAQKVPFPTALGMIFWSSILFILLSIFPVRKRIIEALPENMKHAMSCGIGLFLAFIGLKNLNLIVSSPDTLLKMGALDLNVFLGLVGFMVAFYLFLKQKSYAFLFAILLVTALSIGMGTTQLPSSFVAMPKFENFISQIDIWGAFKLSLLPTILSILLANLFDSISTIIALSNATGLRDGAGRPLRLKQILLVDSFGSLMSSFVGTSPTAVYVESASGIQAGGRTGVVPIVVALCFLPCLFLEPLIHIIPPFATAPVLIFVGILMSMHLKLIQVDGFDDIVPVFLTIVLMPLTSSITSGVTFGIVSYVIIKILAGKYKAISKTLWAIAIISSFVFLTGFTHANFEKDFKSAQMQAEKNSQLSADFKQDYYSALREKTTVSTGKIFLNQNLFRFEIFKPRKQIYINDGKFVWSYEPEFNHANKFSADSDNLAFLKILNNLDNVSKLYRVSEWTAGEKKDGVVNVTLESRSKDDSILNLSIQIKTGYILSLIRTDVDGNKTTLVFSNFSKAGINKNQFSFVPPKGTVINTTEH